MPGQAPFFQVDWDHSPARRENLNKFGPVQWGVKTMFNGKHRAPMRLPAGSQFSRTLSGSLSAGTDVIVEISCVIENLILDVHPTLVLNCECNGGPISSS
jgi:hypothetical protein